MLRPHVNVRPQGGNAKKLLLHIRPAEPEVHGLSDGSFKESANRAGTTEMGSKAATHADRSDLGGSGATDCPVTPPAATE